MNRLKLPPVIGLGLGPLPPPPHGQVTSVGPRSAPLADLPAWADELATIIAYAVVFYGVTAGLHAVNIKGGWVVALALLAVTWMLRAYLVQPVAGLLRQIILAGFHVLVELVEFVGQWLAGITQYFQGDVLKAITRILLLASFMWVFEFAQTIPVIRDILDTIAEATGRVVRFVNESIDGVLGFLHRLRDDINGRLGQLLDHIGLAGQELRGAILDHVSNVFAGLARHVGLVRNQLLAHVDVVQNVLHARVTLLGQTVALVPKQTRDRIVAAYSGASDLLLGDTLSDWRALVARYSPQGATHMAPWEIVDEFREELARRSEGFLPFPVELLTEARRDIRAVQDKNPPARDEWPLTLSQPDDPDVAPLDIPEAPAIPGPPPEVVF